MKHHNKTINKLLKKHHKTIKHHKNQQQKKTIWFIEYMDS